MGALEPERKVRSHELGSSSSRRSDARIGRFALQHHRSTLLHYGYPGRISHAGNLAFPFLRRCQNGEIFEFSIYI
jgi:hypothetical protein